MVGMWKHIDRLNPSNFVLCVEQFQIARLRSRIAANINNFVRTAIINCFNYRSVHSCTWRIGNYNIGFPLLVDKCFIKYIFHIAGKEFGIVQIVEFGIMFGIGNGFF